MHSGAVVKMTAGGRTQSWPVRAGSSYLSQSENEASFGLGSADRAEAVEMVWPSGTTDRHAGLAARRHDRAVEGGAISALAPAKAR